MTQLGSSIVRLEAMASFPVLAAGCAGSFRFNADPRNHQAPARFCASISAPFHLDTLDGDRSARQQIQDLAARHAVVVRAKGCGGSVLPGCSIDEKYAYRPVPLSSDHRGSGDANTIASGAGSAKPGSSNGASQASDVAIAGVYEISRVPSASDLTGACAGATHVVRRYSAGAFPISSNASRSGGLDAPDLGSVHTQNWGDEGRSAGSPETCAARSHASTPDPDCDVRIDLNVTPFAANAPPLEPKPAATAPVVDACAMGNAGAYRAQCGSGSLSSCTREPSCARAAASKRAPRRARCRSAAGCRRRDERRRAFRSRA
jgi:hypothetical protein